MANYLPAVLITISPDHEGGFQKYPNDRANWSGGQVGVGELIGTKYGITALDLPGADIQNLTQADAIAWYQPRYWPNIYNQIKSQLVANKLFDMGVLFGIGTAVGCLQQALGLTVDHLFGPNTLTHCNSADPVSMLLLFKAELHAHAKTVAADNPLEAPDLAGWSRRIDS